MTKRALVGLHNSLVERATIRILSRAGFSVTAVSDLDGMLSAHRDNGPFDAYCMDANLGTEGGPSYEPATEMYDAVEQDVAAGTSRFVAVTGHERLVEQMEADGIPALVKPYSAEELREKLQ